MEPPQAGRGEQEAVAKRRIAAESNGVGLGGDPSLPGVGALVLSCAKCSLYYGLISKYGSQWANPRLAGPHALVCSGNISADPCASSPATRKTYTYDTNGNTIREVSQGLPKEFEYTGSNKIRSVKENGTVVAEYFYGPGDERVASISQGVTAKEFGGLYRIVNGVAEKSYFVGGERIAVKKGSGPLTFYLTDHLGSVRVMVDQSGNVVDSVEYGVYGDQRTGSEPGADEAPYRFTGQKKEATGLHDYNARHYDNTAGRFISPDSIVPDGLDPQSLNRYTYVRNNPINRIDPTGHADLEHNENVGTEENPYVYRFPGVVVTRAEQPERSLADIGADIAFGYWGFCAAPLAASALPAGTLSALGRGVQRVLNAPANAVMRADAAIGRLIGRAGTAVPELTRRLLGNREQSKIVYEPSGFVGRDYVAGGGQASIRGVTTHIEDGQRTTYMHWAETASAVRKSGWHGRILREIVRREKPDRFYVHEFTDTNLELLQSTGDVHGTATAMALKKLSDFSFVTHPFSTN